jgi:hypothetical protein
MHVPTVVHVSTLAGLKAALKARPDCIEITDPTLANQVRLLKSATVPAISAVLAAAGIATGMWWNPIGWGAGVVALTAQSTLTIVVLALVGVLGFSLLWALFHEWEIDVSGGAKTGKHSAQFSMKLRPKKKD